MKSNVKVVALAVMLAMSGAAFAVQPDEPGCNNKNSWRLKCGGNGVNPHVIVTPPGQGGNGGNGGAGGNGGNGGSAVAGAVAGAVAVSGAISNATNRTDVRTDVRNTNLNANLNNNTNLNRTGDVSSTNTNTNTATGGAGGSASSSATGGSATASNAGNTLSITNAAQPSEVTIRTTGVAPDMISSPTAPCRIGVGASAGWLGGAFGVNGSVLDEGCDTREDARMLFNMNEKVAAVARLCAKPEMAAALGPVKCPPPPPPAKSEEVKP